LFELSDTPEKDLTITLQNAGKKLPTPCVIVKRQKPKSKK